MTPIALVVRRAAVLTVCVAMSVTNAPLTGADPNLAPVAPGTVPPDDGRVPSADPSTVDTPDGWILTLGARDEKELPVAPLTTAISSREYLASGTFIAALVGPEPPRGVLEAGYEIGCGIDMSTSNGVTMAGSAGISPGIAAPLPLGVTPTTLLPIVTTPVSGVITVGLKPGLIVVVPVDKKEFKGQPLGHD